MQFIVLLYLIQTSGKYCNNQYVGVNMFSSCYLRHGMEHCNQVEYFSGFVFIVYNFTFMPKQNIKAPWRLALWIFYAGPSQQYSSCFLKFW